MNFTVLLLICLVPFQNQIRAEVKSARLDEINHYLEKAYRENPIPGFSVVVVERDKILFARGYGVTRVGSETPMTEHASSGIGSLTKSFTVMALMRLVEQGRLDLDAPVVTYLPWFRTARKDWSDRITVRMLLGNNSGIPSLDRGIASNDLSEDADERLVKTLSAYVLNREPGDSFEYSNEGFAVAGLIGSKISGLPYPRFLSEYVLQPLAMNHSTSDPARLIELDALDGHFAGFRQGIPASGPNLSLAYAAAGSHLHCSASDLGRYLGMLLNEGVIDGNRVLSIESINAMWRPHTPLPERPGREKRFYGLGWLTETVDGRPVVYHGGNTGTMTSFAMLEPERGFGVGILSNIVNLDGYRYDDLPTLGNNVLHILHGEPESDFGKPSEPDETVNVFEPPQSRIPAYSGNYISAGLSNTRLALEKRDGSLYCKAFQEGVLKLHGLVDFLNPARAVVRGIGTPVMISFKTNLDGSVHGLYYRGAELFRQNDEHSASRTVHRSPAGRVAFSVPGTWQIDWDRGSFLLTRENATVSGGFVPDLETALAPVPSAGEHIVRAADSRGESIGGRYWLNRSLYISRDGEPRQKQIWATSLEDSVFFMTFDVPEGRLSSVFQEIGLDMFQTLAVGSL